MLSSQARSNTALNLTAGVEYSVGNNLAATKQAIFHIRPNPSDTCRHHDPAQVGASVRERRVVLGVLRISVCTPGRILYVYRSFLFMPTA